jgi:hypothetical protein
VIKRYYEPKHLLVKLMLEAQELKKQQSSVLVYAHADIKCENVMMRALTEYTLLQLLQSPQTTGEG